MPRGDGTGPSGQGSMTGRGMGACAPAGTPARNIFGFGRGGGGFGTGRGKGLSRMMPQGKKD